MILVAEITVQVVIGRLDHAVIGQGRLIDIDIIGAWLQVGEEIPAMAVRPGLTYLIAILIVQDDLDVGQTWLTSILLSIGVFIKPHIVTDGCWLPKAKVVGGNGM